MPQNATGQKYIPGLGRDFFIDGTELNLQTITGTQTAANVASSATVELTVTHQMLNINTVPDAPTTTVAGVTVAIDPAAITRTSFGIKVTNTTGATIASIPVTYNRVGL